MSESQKNLNQRVVSSQSENNLRKSVTSVAQSSVTSKERKNRPDRISIRNFISRTFFSPSTSSSSLPPSSSSSSQTKARSNSSQSRKAERKASSVSSRSSPNNLQVLREMPHSDNVLISSVPFSDLLSEASQEDSTKCCGICYGIFPPDEFPTLERNMRCRHMACRHCYRQYLTVQITESRVRVFSSRFYGKILAGKCKQNDVNKMMSTKYRSYYWRCVWRQNYWLENVKLILCRSVPKDNTLINCKKFSQIIYRWNYDAREEPTWKFIDLFQHFWWQDKTNNVLTFKQKFTKNPCVIKNYDWYSWVELTVGESGLMSGKKSNDFSQSVKKKGNSVLCYCKENTFLSWWSANYRTNEAESQTQEIEFPFWLRIHIVKWDEMD